MFDLHDFVDDAQLLAFLERFPTKPDCKAPQEINRWWVFWSQNEHSSSDAAETPDHLVIHEKIKSLFSDIGSDGNYFDGLIQFWAPVTTGGSRRLLTTSNEPFALANIDGGLEIHRLNSINYWYKLDVNNNLEAEEDPMIISGAPAAAFLNNLPEVILDLSVHQGTPLLQSALDCGLMACVVVPVCDPSQRCVGVVECFVRKSNAPISVFNSLYRGLKKQDLSTFSVRKLEPFKTIHGLERVRDQIGEALKFVCEAHYIDFSQVWIPHVDTNHVLSSSSRTDLALKLVGYTDDLNDEKDWSYYDAFDMLPLQMGEGLVGKALGFYQPHLCTDFSESQVSLFDLTASSCFALCLKSTATCDLEYVFQFIWSKRRNHLNLLESLLSTLKKCLASFKLASGAELGDKLAIVNATGNKTELFTIFKAIRSSQTPSLSRATIEEHFGKTMKEAATDLNISVSTLKRKCTNVGIDEWQGRQKLVKKKANDSSKNQIHTSTGYREIQSRTVVGVNTETNLDENTQTIKAKYRDVMIAFDLPISSATFEVVEEKINKRFDLNRGTYMLNYLDVDGDLILMSCEEDMIRCIKMSRLSNSTTIRLTCVTNSEPDI